MTRTKSISVITKAAIGASMFLLTTVAAHAEIFTFASFTSIGQAKNVALSNSGSNTGNTATVYSINSSDPSQFGAVQVQFGFLQDGLSDFVTNVVADFSFNGTIQSSAGNAGPLVYQPVFSGTMSFLSTSEITLGGPKFGNKTFAAGSNLLTITFSGIISGQNGGSAANLNGSTGSGNTVDFSSDFLDFSDVLEKDFAASLNAITPHLTIGQNGSLDSFQATMGGSFSSDPAPVLVGTVPEPASWALMVTGFMMLGTALRQNRSNRLNIGNARL